MTKLVGEKVRLRIWFDEGGRYCDDLLYDPFLKMFREEGFAGATVIRGIAGYGARSMRAGVGVGEHVAGPSRHRHCRGQQGEDRPYHAEDRRNDERGDDHHGKDHGHPLRAQAPIRGTVNLPFVSRDGK